MHYNISTVGLCATKATVWEYSHTVSYLSTKEKRGLNNGFILVGYSNTIR